MFIVTYNCHGFKEEKVKYMKSLLSCCDIMFLQEHWLLSRSLGKLNSSFPDYNVYSKSGVDEAELLYGRSYGGCSIFINKNLTCKTTPIDTLSRRLCCILLEYNDIKLLLISLYMPCDSYARIDEEFEYVLSVISSIQEMYNPDHVIYGGDLNTDLSRSSSVHTLSLNRFCNEYNIISTNAESCGLQTIEFTYCSDINNSCSVIDHFLLSHDLLEFVSNYKTYEDINNPSDHLPLLINIEFHGLVNMKVNIDIAFTEKPMWSKADKDDMKLYQESIDSILTSVGLPYTCTDQCLSHEEHIIVIDNLHSTIIDACMKSAVISIPFTKSKSDRCIPEWNTTIAPLKSEALFWHSKWRQAGGPINGYLATMRRRSRKVYHKQIDKNVKHKKTIRNLRIARSFLDKKSVNFWSDIKKIRGNNKSISSVIDGKVAKKDIVTVFKDKYENVFNSVSYDKCAMEALLNAIEKDIEISCNESKCEQSMHYVECNIVHKVMSHVKNGKSDGYDGLTSDYFINATPLLYKYISILFSMMIKYNYVPMNLCVSTMVSIPKNKMGNLSDSNNYRGIALSSILGKIFDLCIIDLQSNALHTDDLLFAYKSGMSTIQCVGMIKETVSYYISKSSNVYMCMIDASKAFDRVNLVLLFKKLYQRGMCPYILRLLINMYIKQRMRVAWNGCYSDFFSISNGVKQGGVLSPLLFNVYVQDLVVELRKYAIGCHVSGCFTGVFAYADDVTLLAPSCQAINKMLMRCESYADRHDIIFNSSKTKCMLFSSVSCNTQSKGCVMFMGSRLSFVNECTLLGIPISDNIFDTNVSSTVRSFYIKSNSVKSDFYSLPYDIQFSLFSMYCLDVYGCQLWNFNDNSNECFYTAWRKVLRVMWNLPYRTHNVLVPAIFNTTQIDILLETRCIKFLYNCINCNNFTVSLLTQAALNNRRSVIGANFRYLAFKYRIDRHLWFTDIKGLLKCVDIYIEHCNVVNNEAQARGAMIRELLFNKCDDSHLLNNDERKHLLVFLCTM